MGLLLLTAVSGQTHSSTDGTTPGGLAAGAPAGSYALTGFENVNLFNGNLNFHLPLLTVGGRGGAGYTITLAINNKDWNVKTHENPDPNVTPGVTHIPSPNRWVVVPRYSPGVLVGRQSGDMPSLCQGPRTTRWMRTLTRLSFVTADGTEYEFRDRQTGGEPLPTSNPCSNPPAPTRGKVFFTADGTSATFISDDVISDRLSPGGPVLIYPSGYLMLRDGTRYRIVNGAVAEMRDRNGNKLAFGTSTNQAGQTVYTVTDSLNRQIVVTYADMITVFYDEIKYRGFGGNMRTIRVHHAVLNGVMRANVGTEPASHFQMQSHAGLFPEFLGASPTLYFNPWVPAAVELPDGRQYQLRYNSYAELARVELPTGGAIEFDHTIPSGAFAGGEEGFVYRRVTERRVYKEGGTLEGKTTYSTPSTNTADSIVTVDQLSAGGTLLGRSKHYFHGNGFISFFDKTGTTYSGYREGREYQTDLYDSNGTTLLRRSNSTWQQPAAGLNWPLTQAETSDSAKANNPQLTESLTTLSDTNQVTKQTFAYDLYNNQTDVEEYDYGPGAAGAFVRRSHTDYLATNPGNGYDYACDPASNCGTNANIANVVHLRSLPTQVSIYNAPGAVGTLKSQTIFEYDNYGTVDAFHAPIVTYPRPGLGELPISGLEAGFNSPTNNLVRGNVTKTTQQLLNASGEVTGSISSYAQYDVAGNVVKAIDARSTPTNIIAASLDYKDCFGGPDGNARYNAASTELNNAGQYSYAFPTIITNALGQTSYTQFDYQLGRPVDGEDANGIVASGYSENDALDRPTRIIRAVNTSAQNQTVFAYDDASRTITTSSDLNSNGDGALVSKVLYDGLGRTTETRQYEGGANYIATQQKYDALGRAYKTSNPFRPWQSESPVWTTTGFDALGRALTVTTPDGALVATAYSGSQVLVTDQIGKQRLSKTNALGQLKDVWEITAADSATEAISFPGHSEVTAGYHTSYGYDLLDDLTNVTQGSQTRTFAYDSLKRLTSATNPESGAICYGTVTSGQCQANGYDANGNLIYKTDARGILSSYTYDALNRNATIDYSNTSGVNPDLTRLYDGATNGKGRLWESYAGGTYTVGSNVEHTKVMGYDALGRPQSQLQEFKTDGVWGNAYTTQRSYNAAGGVTSQTYPSGHTITYNYDAAGRLGDKDAQNLAFTGNLGDGGAARTYTRAISYSPLGAMVQEQFGTDTAIYNKLAYNSRGQLSEIRESTTPDDSSWNRGKFVNWYSLACGGATCNATDNNGNLRKQEIFVPNNEQNTSATSWYRQYDYDSLNRLQRVHEYTGNTALDWQQEYFYDRYGNRRIEQDVTKTFGVGINKRDFTVNISNNQLGVPSGQTGTMTYDPTGNLITDTYSAAAVSRVYDAENRMTSETQANSYLAGGYTYNADGQRVRRTVGGQPSAVTTWQVYGLVGELLAEYAANAPSTTPQKEYGYRNGQLLITAEAPARMNVALAANGAVATAFSSYNASYPASGANNGDRKLGYGSGGVWHSSTSTFPQWLQIDFNGTKTIDEVDVFTAQDNYAGPAEPTETMTFTLYGLTGYEVQYWNGGAWVTVTGGSITGNNKVWRKITFSPIAMSKIRVLTSASVDSWSRIVELEAWSSAAPAGFNGYAYQRPITVDHSKVPNTDQNNFPMLVSGAYSYLATSANGGNVQNANGYDVIFTSDSGCATKLDHEVENYNAATGAVSYWVKVPTLSHTTDTTIYMCYGNSAITSDQSNKNGVWDANYKGVWHFGNNSLSTTDSTANANNLTNHAASAATGKLLGGASLNGTAGYLEVTNQTAIGSSDFTWEGWVKTSASGVYVPFLSDTYNSLYVVSPNNGGALMIYAGGEKTSAVNVNNGSWHHVVAQRSSSVLKLYIDGVMSANTYANYDNHTTTQFDVGTDTAASNNNAHAGDEVRISNTARSADWINTEYNSQSSPSTFYSVSAASGGGGATSANTNWLVTDHLGTPRMIVDKTGSLAGVRRHDYLPFGEEIFSGTGGRTAAQGFDAADGVRQKFTNKERDNETGLDYFVARYHASTQGRFTSTDTGPFTPADPQNWNRYLYVQNNPVKFVDPSGRKIELTGDKTQDLINYLESKTGLKLQYKTKNGVTTITGAKVNKDFKGEVNKTLAETVKHVAGAEGTAKFNVSENITNERGDVVFMDDNEAAWNSQKMENGGVRMRPGNVNMTSINSVDSQTPEHGMALVGHFLIEGLEMRTGNQYNDSGSPGAHSIGLGVERRILSEALGSNETSSFQSGDNQTNKPISFVYTTVQYDVTIKNDGSATVNKISPPRLKPPK